MKIEYQLNQLKEISLKVTQNFDKKIILISGEMGAGKTTLIKEILIGLNVIDNISSPTFSIINEYKTKNKDDFKNHIFRSKIEVEKFIVVSNLGHFWGFEQCKNTF